MWNQSITRKTEMELQTKPSHGYNLDVFFYQITDRDQYGLLMLRLCFYGGLNIYAAMWPSNASPPANLTMELMNHGIQTIITLGDEKYKFN